MNVWKPIAIVATTGLVVSLGIQTAYANKSSDEPTNLEGPCFDQPNMAAAKGHLEAALGSLQRAEHNKGGWRDRAMNATNTAIAETNAGCRQANR
ncbi:MAG TPA: hypothetical protein VGH28_06985 [Polyangiaceae bacterium]|jgi:hypothetical protein